MALRSYAQRSSCNNLLANSTREQDKLASPQSPAKRLDVGSNKASTPPEAPTSPLILPTKDLFTKFMKAFMVVNPSLGPRVSKILRITT